MFRFTVDEIERLADVFRLPEMIRSTDDGVCAARVEALCILFRRLCYPNRLFDSRKEFGRSMSNFDRVYLRMVGIVHGRYGRVLDFDAARLAGSLESFAQAVHRAGAPLPNVWGFVDGTARAIARPTQNQRLCYSGPKRYHCLKFQAITRLCRILLARTKVAGMVRESVTDGSRARMEAPRAITSAGQ